MVSAQKRILAIGLKPQPGTEKAFGDGYTGEQVQAKIHAETQRLKEAGYEIDFMLIDPQEFDASLPMVKDRLRDEAWDAFLIGNGIRSTGALTVQFEWLVNASREVAPQTKLIFNLTPDALWDPVTRNLA